MLKKLSSAYPSMVFIDSINIPPTHSNAALLTSLSLLNDPGSKSLLIRLTFEYAFPTAHLAAPCLCFHLPRRPAWLQGSKLTLQMTDQLDERPVNSSFDATSD